MKKAIILLLILSVFGIQAAQATDLRALNVQNARISEDTDHQTELRINFDWFRDHFQTNEFTHFRSTGFNLPRIDIRQACTSCPIPFRIGLNTAFNIGDTENEVGDTNVLERSAIGFGNLGLTIEAGLIQKDYYSLNAYINQTFPMIHNDLLIAGMLRPVSGANAYGFQTGFLYEWHLADNLIWYGDIGYRFDIPDNASTQHSLVYYNEAVLALGDEHNYGLLLGLLGNTVYSNDIGTDLRIVPGFTAKVGDSGQLRFGLPLGINPDSTDIGVQAGYFVEL